MVYNTVFDHKGSCKKDVTEEDRHKDDRETCNEQDQGSDCTKRKHKKRHYNNETVQRHWQEDQRFKSWWFPWLGGTVEHTVKEIEKRGTAGGYTVHKLVKSLTNKPKPQPANLTTDSDPNLLKSPEEMTKVWEDFLRPKVTATLVEVKRLSWDTLHSTPVRANRFNI